MLLGSQSLISFRDKITCLNDQVVVGDNTNESAESTPVPMKVRSFTLNILSIYLC